MSTNPYRRKSLDVAIEMARQGEGTKEDFLEAGFPAELYPEALTPSDDDGQGDAGQVVSDDGEDETPSPSDATSEEE